MSLFNCNSICTTKRIFKSYFNSWKLPPQLLYLCSDKYGQVISGNKIIISRGHWSLSKNLNSITSNQHTDSTLLSKKIQHLRTANKCFVTHIQAKNIQHSASVKHCSIFDSQCRVKENILKINGSFHCSLVVQFSTNTDQFSVTDIQPTADRITPNMASSKNPTTRCQHVENTLAVVSDKDIQLMNDARQIFDQAVHAVLPHHLVKNKLKLTQDGTVLKVDEAEYTLKRNVYVIGFGKAVIGMARAVDDCVGPHIVKGVISVPTGIQQMFNDEGKEDMLVKPGSHIEVIEGAAGNLPDEASHKAAMEIIKIADVVKDDDILIVLISGGGSALLPSPKPPVTLGDMLSLTRLMSKSGASIIQLNTVRKEIEMLKGGGLAKLAQPAKVIALILSDVIGDPLDFIAGGPTVQNTCTVEDSIKVLQELHVWSSIPPSVNHLLTAENNRSFDGVNWSLVQNVLVGSNKSACESACSKSATLGYLPYLLSTQVEGEAQEVGKMYINLAKYICSGLKGLVRSDEYVELENQLVDKFSITAERLQEMQGLAKQAVTSGKKGVCIVAGGETTVVVKGQGIGGRNQEMAVAAALELESKFLNPDESHDGGLVSSASPKVVFLAAGTDGIDGPNPAAGGVISVSFKADAEVSGLDVADSLTRNDTYTLLSQVNHGLYHVVTGHTGTNVMDIHILLINLS